MPLHIIKLSVGSEDIDDMYKWLKDSKAGRDKFSHTTRMFPRRKEEVLAGGSLYWVIKGVVLCRTPIADLVPVTGKDGIERCRIELKHQIFPVYPIPRRAFQGWRYFKDEDVPRDLPKGDRAKDIPPKMRKELIELGLL
jgi:hypothetical protein